MYVCVCTHVCNGFREFDPILLWQIWEENPWGNATGLKDTAVLKLIPNLGPLNAQCKNILTFHMGVSIHGGYPNSWLVYKGKSH